MLTNYENQQKKIVEEEISRLNKKQKVGFFLFESKKKLISHSNYAEAFGSDPKT